MHQQELLDVLVRHPPRSFDVPADLIDVQFQEVEHGQDDVQVSYETLTDSQPPKTVTLKATPEKRRGCVEAGEKIEVTITASEEGTNSWQTGTQSIQLKANGVAQGSAKTYPDSNCNPDSWTETWTTAYTVPSPVSKPVTSYTVRYRLILRPVARGVPVG